MVRLETALLTLALLASSVLGACHPDASEPSPAPSGSAATSAAPTTAASAAASTAPQAEPANAQTHRIVPKDHRSVVPMHVGDIVAAPDDASFAWRIDLEDKSAFVHVKDADESYRVTKVGAFRIMVFGDPKACMNTDAACTVSKRRWDVTLAVQ